MDELSRGKRIAGYVVAIFLVWFFWLPGYWRLWLHPSVFFLEHALVVAAPTLVVPIGVGLLFSLRVFCGMPERKTVYRLFLAGVVVLTVILMNFYAAHFEDTIRYGLAFDEQHRLEGIYGGFFSVYPLPGAGPDRTLFVAIAAAAMAAAEIRLRRRALQPTAEALPNPGSDYTSGYHLPFITWLLAVPAVSNIWHELAPGLGAGTFGDVGLIDWLVHPGTALSTTLNLAIAAVFGVWCFRLAQLCKRGGLVIGPTSLRLISGEIVVREVDWQDISAVSHSRAKPIRFVRIVTSDGKVSVPASCLDSPAEVVGLIRERTNLTEETKSLLWVRYGRGQQV